MRQDFISYTETVLSQIGLFSTEESTGQWYDWMREGINNFSSQKGVKGAGLSKIKHVSLVLDLTLLFEALTC